MKLLALPGLPRVALCLALLPAALLLQPARVQLLRAAGTTARLIHAEWRIRHRLAAEEAEDHGASYSAGFVGLSALVAVEGVVCVRLEDESFSFSFAEFAGDVVAAVG